MRAISSGFTCGDAAKPHAPSTITRTPNPKLPPSAAEGTSSVLPVPRSGFRRTLRNCSSVRMMRISQYVALSFFASRNATAPRFSSAAFGFLASAGAAKRRAAKAAPELWRKVRLVSMDVGSEGRLANPSFGLYRKKSDAANPKAPDDADAQFARHGTREGYTACRGSRSPQVAPES